MSIWEGNKEIGLAPHQRAGTVGSNRVIRDPSSDPSRPYVETGDIQTLSQGGGRVEVTVAGHRYTTERGNVPEIGYYRQESGFASVHRNTPEEQRIQDRQTFNPIIQTPGSAPAYRISDIGYLPHEQVYKLQPRRYLEAQQERSGKTFTVYEGRVAQEYYIGKGSSFGRNLFGQEQGEPEPGKAYRKSWIGTYKEVPLREAKTVSKGTIAGIRTADIYAPWFTPISVFKSSAMLRGASIRGASKIDTSGFASRYSTWKKPQNIVSNTFSRWKVSPSGYSSPSSSAFLQRWGAGFPKEETGFEEITTLQTIDRRKLKFEGSGNFVVSLKRPGAEPLNKFLERDIKPSRSSQLLKQIDIQKPIIETAKPVFVLSREKVPVSVPVSGNIYLYRKAASISQSRFPKMMSRGIVAGIETEFLRTPQGYNTIQGLKLGVSSGLRQSTKTGLKLSTSLELRTSQLLKLNTSQGLELSISQGLRLSTAQSLKLGTLQGLKLGTLQLQKMGQTQKQATRQEQKTVYVGSRQYILPRIKQKLSFGSFGLSLRKRRRGKYFWGKFIEISPIATPRQVSSIKIPKILKNLLQKSKNMKIDIPKIAPQTTRKKRKRR